MKTAAHYFYHSTLSVYICAVISSTACHRQYVSCVGMQTDVTKKVITALNSKCSFIQGTQSVVVQAWEAFQKRRITLPCWARYVPNRNPLTGSSEVLFSLPILLSGVGRGPLHIRRDQCEESRHCQGITNTISSSDIQWNTELWAIREWNMCASMCHVLRLRGSDENRTKCRDAVQ